MALHGILIIVFLLVTMWVLLQLQAPYAHLLGKKLNIGDATTADLQCPKSISIVRIAIMGGLGFNGE